LHIKINNRFKWYNVYKNKTHCCDINIQGNKLVKCFTLLILLVK